MPKTQKELKIDDEKAALPFTEIGIILIALLISPMGRKTIQERTEKIHKDYLASFWHAKVWGASVDFRGHQLGLEHVLTDSDIAEITINRQD